MNITDVHINITIAELLYSVPHKYEQNTIQCVPKIPTETIHSVPHKYQQKQYILCPKNAYRDTA
jgi:hypothetical protein